MVWKDGAWVSPLNLLPKHQENELVTSGLQFNSRPDKRSQNTSPHWNDDPLGMAQSRLSVAGVPSATHPKAWPNWPGSHAQDQADKEIFSIDAEGMSSVGNFYILLGALLF